MFAWIARLLRRSGPFSTTARDAGVTVAVPAADAASSAPPPDTHADGPAPAHGEQAAPTIRKMDYAILLTDSGSLEDLPQGSRYLELARQHGGILQPSVSGLTLILFEPAEEGAFAPGRIAFAEELEKKALARIRCLHGQSPAIRHGPARDRQDAAITLLNFHVLVQHAAALDLGAVTEAGSYLAAQKGRARRKPVPAKAKALEAEGTQQSP